MSAQPRNQERLVVTGMVACLVALGLSAGEARASRGEPSWNAGRSVAFTTLERYDQGPYGKSCALVTQTAASWIQEMTAMADHLLVLPAPSAPEVDWSTHSVLLVATGTQTSYQSVEVRSVHRVGKRLRIDVHAELAESMGGMYSPYHLVELSIAAKALQDLEVEVRFDCGNCGRSGTLTPRSLTVATGEPYNTQEGRSPEPEMQTSWGALKARYR